MTTEDKDIIVIPNEQELEKQFEYVDALIEQHRSSAIAKVNTEAILTNWEVGQYISHRLKSAQWGSKVVSDLADYLKRQNPKRRGFGKRHLYNMVKFYETYCDEVFIRLIGELPIPEFVQSRIAQIEKYQSRTEIVQLPIAQLDEPMEPMPKLLALVPFTSHLEIMNRCKSYEERVFYMLYAAHQRLKGEELRAAIVHQAYTALMDKEKMLSPRLLAEYPNADFMLKDKAVLDFLNLPLKHNEHHLHTGLLEHMKQFILELGKDFLFVDSEYGVQVGGSTKRIDLLFYHRGLQCLNAPLRKAP